MSGGRAAGALGIEIRAGDEGVKSHLSFLDDHAARVTTTCERAMLNAMGGGCQVPIAAFARLQGTQLHLQGVVAHPDGSPVIRFDATGDEALALGNRVAEELLQRGGKAVLAEVYRTNIVAPQQP